LAKLVAAKDGLRNGGVSGRIEGRLISLFSANGTVANQHFAGDFHGGLTLDGREVAQDLANARQLDEGPNVDSLVSLGRAPRAKQQCVEDLGQGGRDVDTSGSMPPTSPGDTGGAF
jgi:hypothetical protein